MIAKKDIPNALTLLRFLLIPLIALAIEQEQYLLAFIGFTIACITDFLDGYLARKFKAVSLVGGLVDNIADKLLVATVLIYLVREAVVSSWLAVVLIGREIIVSSLREVAAHYKLSLPSSKLAKWKTTTQMAALAALFLGQAGSSLEIMEFAIILLIIAALLAVVTMVSYLIIAWKRLRQPKENK